MDPNVWSLLGIPSLISCVLFFVFQLIFNKIRDKHNQNDREDTALHKGVQALLRDRLIDGYNTFINRGYVSIVEKQNYDNMYHAYHDLGKNGVMDSMYNEVMELPIK